MYALSHIWLVLIACTVQFRLSGCFFAHAVEDEPTRRRLAGTGRRILVHAAPGTGGSLLLFIMAQSHNSIAFPNLRVPPPSAKELADVPKEYDVMLKVTMGDSNTSLVEAIERFEPDVKILLVRHPASVAQAVGTASRGVGTLGRARGGELMPRDAVLSRLEWTWAMSGTQWDTVLLFEELLFNPAVARQKLRTAGFSEASLDSMDRMRRSKKDVERFNGKHSRWSRSQRVPSKYARDASNQLVGWDFGGASRNPAQQLQQLRDTFPTSRPSDSMRRKAASLCPLLSAYYSAHHPELDAPPQGGNGKTDAWLVAVQRLYKLVDDRAATFQGDDETPSIAAAHDGVGGRLRTHLRERWIMVALATNTWVRNGVTFNWMASLRRVGVSSFIVVSLDLPTHEALSAIGAPSFFHETHYADVAVGVGASGSSRAYRASLLSYKWKVLAAILKRGVATLLTDVDSVVLRDFRPLLDQSRSHIIGGRGNTKQLLVRLPFLLVRSCVEVLHVLPRLIADIAKYRDDEYALNKLLAGIVAWAEPPLKAQDRFVEGRTFRPVGGGGPLGHASGSATGTGGALDLALRLTLIPNRLLRLYECTKGHPAETALVMHCGNENLTTATGAKQPLVMTRSGQLVEPSSSSSSSIATSMLTTTAGLSGSTEGGEFARLRLTELGLWMLTPKWRQQFDLIQSRVHRNTVQGGVAPRGFGWSEFGAWIHDNTAWTLPDPHVPGALSEEVQFGAARKASKKKKNTNSVISGHNLKRNCRHQLPIGLEAAFMAPAIKCT